MISSWWNFCTCPSMPFAKLNSEYRSTFQWPDFRGPQQTNSSSVRAIVQQPLPIPYLYSEPQGIPRRKRAPGFAQQVQQSSTTLDWIGHPDKEKVVNLQKDKDEITVAPTHVHIQVKDSKNKDNTSMRGAAGKPSVRVPSDILENNTISVLPPQGKIMNREKMDLKIAEGREERRNERLSKSAHIDQVDKDHNKVERRIDPTKGEYQTEYKKRYRPFSQYEYILPEGKFTKKKSDRELGGPWYYEVIELRKKAEEYKFRGYGSELIQNGGHVHNHHLWEEVSKRKSLAGLALIAATSRYVTKEEKEKENNRKSFAGKASPFIRPHTATPRHAMPDLDKPTKSPYEFETVHIKKKQPPFDTSGKPLHQANVSRAKARSLSAGPGHGGGSGGRSPRKSTRQQSSSSSDHEAGGGWKPQAISSKGEVVKLQQAKHPRPTTLATSPRPKTSSGQKGHDVRDSKLARHGQYFKSSADPSLGYHQDVANLCKTPPEPTRVKSPEQLIAKSPDPVNWTVPLDKGFTVTQNVKDGERPQFHSSTATGDSVKSSPAINSATSKNKNSSQVPTSMKKQSSTDKDKDKENKKSTTKQQELNGYEEKEKLKDKPKSSIFSRMKKSEDSSSSSPTTSSSKKTSDKKADDKLTKPVPGTNLRCLEDPTFMFDPAPSAINNSENSKNLNLNPSPSKPVGLGENSPGKPAYRVLEAPYGSDHDSPKGSSHSRSKASDVLEKARNKFDKFWGKDKSKDEEK